MTPRPHASFRSSVSDGACAASLGGGPNPRGEGEARREAEGHRRCATAAFIAAALAGTLLLPAAAGAQTGGWVGFNGATQATATTFTDNVGFIEFHEDADFDADYAVGTGAVFDGGAGVRLANGIGFGVAVSRFERLDPVSLDARIPHPFFFDRPRSLAGSEPDLTRLETAVHVEVRWFQSVSDTVELAVFGGPTLFNVRQDLVSAIGYDHAYPYDEASLASATTAAASASTIGFHAGADVGFFFSETVGLGALIRYSGGSVDLPGEGEGTVAIDTGGFHVGGGLRLRF
jgi:hypothetical protein